MPGHPDVAEPQVNVTPLIDVMLVLLVILIITLPVATQVVELNLPHGDGAAPPRTVRVDIYSGGEMYLNDEHVDSIAELLPRFEALAQMENPPYIKVVPDKRAPYERVAQVLAAAQHVHVKNMSVAPVAESN